MSVHGYRLPRAQMWQKTLRIGPLRDCLSTTTCVSVCDLPYNTMQNAWRTLKKTGVYFCCCTCAWKLKPYSYRRTCDPYICILALIKGLSCPKFWVSGSRTPKYIGVCDISAIPWSYSLSDILPPPDKPSAAFCCILKILEVAIVTEREGKKF